MRPPPHQLVDVLERALLVVVGLSLLALLGYGVVELLRSALG